jgi:glutamine amidotransferase
MKKTINTTQRMIEEFGSKEGYSTFNFSLTDGETMVVTRFCDKGAEIPPPSLYFAFGDAHSLYRELTNENPKPLFSSKSSASSLDTHGKDKSDSSVHSDGESGSVDSDGFDERAVFLNEYASRPGKVMEEVDASTAAFIVSSNPLTRTHRWHPMPRNSIMWCTRGQHPELSVLKRRQNTLMSTTELKL